MHILFFFILDLLLLLLFLRSLEILGLLFKLLFYRILILNKPLVILIYHIIDKCLLISVISRVIELFIFFLLLALPNLLLQLLPVFLFLTWKIPPFILRQRLRVTLLHLLSQFSLFIVINLVCKFCFKSISSLVSFCLLFFLLFLMSCSFKLLSFSCYLLCLLLLSTLSFMHFNERFIIVS